MNDHGIWIVDHNRMIRYIPLTRPLTRRQRLVAWFKAIWPRLLIWLAVITLLAGCTIMRNSGTQYGPGWPHAVCDTISTCWPVDGAPR